MHSENYIEELNRINKLDLFKNEENKKEMVKVIL